MSAPYFVYSDSPEVIFDAATEGLIAPDGNSDWVAFESWRDAGGVPDVREDPALALRSAGIAKLIALGLTEDEASAIAGNLTSTPTQQGATP